MNFADSQNFYLPGIMKQHKIILGSILASMLLLFDNTFAFSRNSVNSVMNTYVATNIDTSQTYQVTFSNQSAFSNPGFVRCPFLFGFDELNIFIHFDTKAPFKTVACNEPAELFYSGDTYIPYILKQRDTVYIENSKQDRYGLFSKDKIRNNEICFFQAAVSNKIPLLYWETGNQMKALIDVHSVSNNILALQKIYKNTQAFTESYIQNHRVSDDFKTFITSYIRFDHYVKVFNYIKQRSIIDSLIKSNYFDFQCQANNSFYNCDYAFQSALYQYVRFILKSDINENTISEAFEIANAHFNQANSSIIKFLALKNCMKELYIKNKPVLLRLLDETGNDKYRAVIQNKIANYEFSIANQNSIIDSYGNKLALKDIIAKSRGKVVLIDFWASWCQPCRNEFSYYHNLKAHLDTSKISFVFISIDRSKISWATASRFEGLAPATSYLLVNPTTDVLRKMNLLSIPRYYLIGRDGLIKTNEAPAPSDERLSSQINRLLKNNN